MYFEAFSISLNSKNISASKEFYEAIGFSVFHGEIDQKWLIMKNKTATIGLFQGMFEKNILIFNPGWDSEANIVTEFLDFRRIQKKFQDKEINITRTVKKDTSGPGNMTLLDPDGNPILIDQHI